MNTVLRKDKWDNGKVKKVVLKKDLIIPAGTEFETAPSVTHRNTELTVQAYHGLTKDSTATIDCYLDDDKAVEEWFEIVEA